MNTLKKIEKYWVDSVRLENRKNILRMLSVNPDAKLLDLGCDNGDWTSVLAKKIGTKDVYGVELIKTRAEEAEKKGIRVKSFDLNGRFDYEAGYFDVVHSNQVIEHLYDTDNFISESYRVLKPGGYVIVSTVNLSGWHNIASLLLGYQPFDMANISVKGNIGNPFSIWNKSESEASRNKSWQHVRLFTIHSLSEFLKAYGFSGVTSMAAGYYPLPNLFSRLDKTHSHYIVVKALK